MNGAESLVDALVRSGVDTCFVNPGTSEMHFVSALDRILGIRSILCLFEGCVTGAADGYGRMAEKPAATLLHLGPGLAYGGPNLHNARRANSPIVNIVGDHATYHRAFDAPLTSDVEAISRTFSDWTKTSSECATVGQDAAELVQAATRNGGNVATLILPANAAWEENGNTFSPLPRFTAETVSDDCIQSASEILKAKKTIIILGGDALKPNCRAIARGIADARGADIIAPVGNRRIDRGRGTVPIERIPFSVDLALDRLSKYEAAILVGTKAPVAFFAYPGKPGRLLSNECSLRTLAEPSHNSLDALERLAENLGVGPAVSSPTQRIEIPENGPLTPAAIAGVLAALSPENSIVCDESVTVGRGFYTAMENAAPHSWLQITGGSIGSGVPMATGAAVACPNRKVIAIVGDGSAMYTIQALWTQARENLDVTTIILSNKSYAILKGELRRVGAQSGRTALRMLSLDDPEISFVDVANGLGVRAKPVTTVCEFAEALQQAFTSAGPMLIDVSVSEA